jgi:hypothetical protein
MNYGVSVHMGSHMSTNTVALRYISASHERRVFEKNKVIEHKMCVLIFSTAVFGD